MPPAGSARGVDGGEEIARFFTVYKDLEPERVSAIEGWAGRDAAEDEIARARQRLAELR